MAIFLKKYCGDPSHQRNEAVFAMGAYLGAKAEASIYINVRDSDLEAFLKAPERRHQFERHPKALAECREVHYQRGTYLLLELSRWEADLPERLVANMNYHRIEPCLG